MPPFQVNESDAYLCTSVKLPDTAQKLTSVKPRSDQDVVHHMLLFGCKEPAQGETAVWPCMGNVCQGSESVLYGWGRNAEAVTYPKGVAFSVGKGTDITTLVLQIHYLTGRAGDDKSGVDLELSNQPSEKTASVVMYASGFSIPPGQDVYRVPNKCCYSGFEPIHTVAFRVHTHELGRSVYMKKSSKLDDEGRLIATRHPLLPQGFVPVTQPTIVHPGEFLEVSCEFNSSKKTEVVNVGATHNDEMCNMYMIVYSDIPYFGQCFNDQGFYINQANGVLKADDRFLHEMSVGNFWVLPSESPSIGEAVGVARGNNGDIWLLHRGANRMNMNTTTEFWTTNDPSLINTNPVLILDPKTGKTKDSWGKLLFNIPHMITINADDSVWITDVGKHQVFKFSSSGEPLMTLGEEFVPGNKPHQFCAPTQAITLTDGSTLISDGYCNHRILKYNARGEFVKELNDPELRVPHSLIADECNDLLYVADREGQAVVFYNLTTLDNRLGSLKLANWAMALTRGPFDTFLILSWNVGSNGVVHQFRSQNVHPKIVSSWDLDSSAMPHDLVLSSAPVELTGAGDRLFALYIAELQSSNLRKFILAPSHFHPLETAEPTITDNPIEVGHGQTKAEIVKEVVLYQEKSSEINLKRGTPTAQSSQFARSVSLILPGVAILLAIVYIRRSRRRVNGDSQHLLRKH